MPEIGTSGSMSGDGKRGVAEWPKLPRPLLRSASWSVLESGLGRTADHNCSIGDLPGLTQLGRHYFGIARSKRCLTTQVPQS